MIMCQLSQENDNTGSAMWREVTLNHTLLLLVLFLEIKKDTE